MGTPKGLVVHRGQTFLEWQIARLADAGVETATVVLGHGASDYRAKVAFVDAALGARDARVGSVSIRVVLNPEPDRGPFSSLVVALHGLLTEFAELEGVFVLPVDVPCPKPPTWSALRSRFDASRPGLSPVALVPTVAGRGGHPVLVDRAFAARLVARDPNGPGARLDHAIAELGEEAKVRVPVDDLRAVMNLNTPEDFARFDV